MNAVRPLPKKKAADRERKDRKTAAPGVSSSRSGERRVRVPQTGQPPARPRVPTGIRTAAPASSPSRPAVSVTPVFKPLFVAPDVFCRKALELLPGVLDGLLPLNRSHRGDLPNAIRDLSDLLTTERSGLGRSYWSAPRFVSAYLRYFLPWNLVRLTRLLPGLTLPDPAVLYEERRQILDVGSGPLTLPLALWLSRPEWRKAELTLHCTDTAPRPMELGRKLLEALAEAMHEPLKWKVRLSRSTLPAALRENRRVLLLTAGNVLNELPEREELREERLGELAQGVGRCLHEHGAALCVEPGTRLGGGIIAALRESALAEGLEPAAPCTHLESCPLLGRRERGWCHVSLDAGGPVWLASLSKAARLPKDSLSLSFLLLRPGDPEFREEEQGKELLCRVISDAFPVPGLGPARYACCAAGLALLPEAADLPSGSVVVCPRPASPARDAKSGAVLLPWKAAVKTAGAKSRQPV